MDARTAVELVLSFRASCACGWWRIYDDEKLAIGDLARHQIDTRCDGCTDTISHNTAVVASQGTWSGAFCGVCAPSYSA